MLLIHNHERSKNCLPSSNYSVHHRNLSLSKKGNNRYMCHLSPFYYLKVELFLFIYVLLTLTVFSCFHVLLSDAECKICKYKSLIISAYSSNYMGQILCRGTEEGRKIYKNLQMKLPSKIKYTNICKDVFPVLIHICQHGFLHNFCILCDASQMRFTISVPLGTFIFAVLCISL